MSKLISGAALCLLAFNVNAALILDQAYAPVVPDNTSPGDVFYAHGDVKSDAYDDASKQAQTFTVGISGSLSQVNLYLNGYSSTNGDEIFADIRRTIDGAPSDDAGDILGTAVLGSAVWDSFAQDIPYVCCDTFGYMPFQFNVDVLAGEQLAIVLYTEGTVALSIMGNTQYTAGMDPYIGGSIWGQSNYNNGEWYPNGGSSYQWDWGFQTYVETSAVPIPAAVWLFGSGLIGLIGVARKKARV